jgi:hypothetical protein
MDFSRIKEGIYSQFFERLLKVMKDLPPRYCEHGGNLENSENRERFSTTLEVTNF